MTARTAFGRVVIAADRARQIGEAATEDRDLVAEVVEFADHERADEAGAADDQHTHYCTPNIETST
ncbi:MAG TPA: hypothetical protein VEU62_17495 [Bryobacterales bacterium]|nr:hypothetical protein [Bryobacterales bacterium]